MRKSSPYKKLLWPTAAILFCISLVSLAFYTAIANQVGGRNKPIIKEQQGIVVELGQCSGSKVSDRCSAKYKLEDGAIAYLITSPSTLGQIRTIQTYCIDPESLKDCYYQIKY